jgi:hypothetical protein
MTGSLGVLVLLELVVLHQLEILLQEKVHGFGHTMLVGFPRL